MAEYGKVQWACILALRKLGSLHAYAAWEEVGGGKSSVYEALRALERKGVVSSIWESGAEGHPGRRTYTLTEEADGN